MQICTRRRCPSDTRLRRQLRSMSRRRMSLQAEGTRPSMAQERDAKDSRTAELLSSPREIAQRWYLGIVMLA